MKKKREIVAIILLPLIYFYVMKLPSVYFLVLISLASGVAQIEFYSMYHVKRFFKLLGTISGLLLLYFFYIDLNELSLLIILFFLLVVLVRLFHTKEGPENALSDIASVIIGFIYIPLILGLQILIRKVGPEWVIYTVGTVWASDSFAYYLGKRYGEKKLYPVVSPKKTITGAIGSIIGGTIFSIIIKIFLIDTISIYQSLFFGFIIGGVTLLGDLSESMFKRDSTVKDSSFLIPGHGGVLDKIDGILFTTPVVYVIVKYVIR